MSNPNDLAASWNSQQYLMAVMRTMSKQYVLNHLYVREAVTAERAYTSLQAIHVLKARVKFSNLIPYTIRSNGGWTSSLKVRWTTRWHYPYFYKLSFNVLTLIQTMWWAGKGINRNGKFWHSQKNRGDTAEQLSGWFQQQHASTSSKP